MTTIGNHLFQPSGDNAVRTSISFIASSSSRLILRGHDTEGECCYLIFDFHVEICIEMKWDEMKRGNLHRDVKFFCSQQTERREVLLFVLNDTMSLKANSIHPFRDV